MKLTPLKSGIICGVGFCLFFGIYQALSCDLKHALILSPMAGTAFGIMMYFSARAGKANR